MDDFTFSKQINEQEFADVLRFSGNLTVGNSEKIKNELLLLSGKLNSRITIEIEDVQEIDISFIQIVLSLVNYMDDHHISYKFQWTLEPDVRDLIEGVGLGNELFLN